MSYLGDYLQRLRGSRTLYEVEHSAGISRGALSRYERGMRVPESGTLKTLAEYYGVPYRELRKHCMADMFTDPGDRELLCELAQEFCG